MTPASDCDHGSRPRVASPAQTPGEGPPAAIIPAHDDRRVREAALRISLAVERARGQAALRESEERYAALFNGIDEGFCIIEMRIEPDQPLDFRIVDVNQALECQSTLAGAKGRWVRGLLPELEERWFEIYRDVALTGQPVRIEEMGQAFGNRWFDVCAFRIGAPQYRRVGVLFKDITERHQPAHELRRAEDELEHAVHERTVRLAQTCASLERELHERRVAEGQVRALVRQLVTIQEHERRAMVQAVHDLLAQPVTAVRMHLEALCADGGGNCALGSQIERLRALSGELDECIESLTRDLGPVALLDDLGLGAALQHLVRGWSRRSGVPAEFQAWGIDDLRLAPHAAVHLYRIVQDALQNVQHHARATRAGVVVERCGGRLAVIVEDDGVGFDPACVAATAPEGLGLVGMRERAALIGGELEVESTPGVGTVVYVRQEVGRLGG
jgi:signal transduction histidine kinase